MKSVDEKVKKTLNTGWKMWFYFLWRLPSVLWFGIRIEQVNAAQGIVSLPFTWRSQNPFRSVYFAAQCAAAELSTGILVLAAIGGQAKVSMLVTRLDMEFVKKATSTIVFTCGEGSKIREAVNRTIQSGEPQTISVETTGVQSTGEVVSRARLTWSFKLKT